MALLDVEEQVLLTQKIGDVDPATGDPVSPVQQGSTGIVMASVGALWTKYAPLATTSTELRDLYVQRDALDMVIGVLERLVDFTQSGEGGHQLTMRMNQRVQARERQRDRVQKRIDGVLSTLGLSSAAVGQLTTTAPTSPPPFDVPPPGTTFRPDANSPVYGGSPYFSNARPSTDVGS